MLLILDGYDEYKRGTNKEIDEAIESTIGNCFLLLTSRTGNYVTKRVRDKMAGEYTVEGFSEENIVICSELYLSSGEISADMLECARKSSVGGLLHVPIVLLMVCVSYYHNRKSLSSSKTGLLGTLFHLLMDRATLKSFDEKSSKLGNLEQLLYALGELSWKSLARETHQLLLSKVRGYLLFLSSHWKSIEMKSIFLKTRQTTRQHIESCPRDLTVQFIELLS